MSACTCAPPPRRPSPRFSSFSLSPSFSLLAWQNGAGKSSIIKLLAGSLQPDWGSINVEPDAVVSTAKQTMPVDSREMTVKAYFASQFRKEGDDGDDCNDVLGHRLPAMIAEVLREVELEAPLDRVVKSFSGGQQARLLLAAALITNPDILLLDEPTNNLDQAGIERLRDLITDTDKTCLVISHDEGFLNSNPPASPPARLPAYPPARLPACPPARLRACAPARLPNRPTDRPCRVNQAEKFENRGHTFVGDIT